MSPQRSLDLLKALTLKNRWTHRGRKQRKGCQRLEGKRVENGEWLLSAYRVWDDEKFLKPDTGDLCTLLWTCVCECVCAQSCPTLCNPVDCSLPGSSVHGIFSASTKMCCHELLQGIFPNQGSNPCLLCLLHWMVGSLPLALLGSMLILGH